MFIEEFTVTQKFCTGSLLYKNKQPEGIKKITGGVFTRFPVMITFFLAVSILFLQALCGFFNAQFSALLRIISKKKNSQFFVPISLVNNNVICKFGLASSIKSVKCPFFGVRYK
jgi:hypothetical protein